MSQPVRWVVVENAGMVGERDVYSAPTANDCHSYMECSYSCIEVQELHVDMCQEFDNGDRLYEY